MFGEKIDGHITMLQRVVALARDVIIGLVVALTTSLVYFGRDPSTLTMLDWSRLVSAAVYIVVAPLLTFIAFESIYSVFYGIFPTYFALLSPDSPLPKGLFAWIAVVIFRIPRREYVRRVWRARQRTKMLAVTNPSAYGSIHRLLKFLDSYARFHRKVGPYLIAFFALGYGIWVFYRTIAEYMP